MGGVSLEGCVVRLEPGGMLHVRWNRGVSIEESNARAAVEAVDRVAAGGRYPLLVEMTGISTITHDARAIFAQPCAASRIALLGTSPVDQMIVSYQLGVGAVACPTRFFTSKDEALVWLHQAAPKTGVSAL